MLTKYYMIGNAHLDPVWMWRWQEGYAETKATVRSALDRMKEYPEFKFVCASAAAYSWIEECDSDMFEEIKERIREGRWIVAGGWWVQPDCNLPSGEGLARQSLYAQRYFKEKLGVTAKTGYCVDSFGHNWMIPQILKKSGMDSYVFMRPKPHEMILESNLFWWEAPDGSRVKAFRLHDTYCCDFHSMEELEKKLELLKNELPDCFDSILCFYGVGNHGGGPTIQNIELIRQYQKEHPEMKLYFADPQDFFSALSAEQVQELPLLKDDLQHYACGCYSAYAPIKSAIRKSETRLLSAEKYAFLASTILNSQYPTEEFKKAWKDVCFIHFHDITGGCAIEKSYHDSIEFAGEAQTIAGRAENAALQKLSWSIDTSDKEKGLPIVIFNSHAWPVKADIIINKMCNAIYDGEGKRILSQAIYSQAHSCHVRTNTLFQAQIPALGYAIYYWKNIEEDENREVETSIKIDKTDTWLCAYSDILENRYLRVEFDGHRGYIKSVFDKENQKELFAGNAAVPVVIDEFDHDTWSNEKNYFTNRLARFTDATLRVKEAGPVRGTIEVVSRYNQSVLTQEFSLSEDSRQLEVKCTVDWREKHKMLKLAFPVNLAGEPGAYYNIPYGWIKRPCNGEEEPGQLWIAVQDSESGMAILNDRKYGFSVEENTMYLTAIRSPIYGDHGGPRDADSEFTDQGLHTFHYALLPYQVQNGGTDFSAVYRKAEEFNTPVVNILENNHIGFLPQSYEGIRVDAEHIIVSALKRAEDEGGWILRAFETGGKTCETKILLTSLRFEFTVCFTPFEVKTLYIEKSKENGYVVKEVLMTEYEM